MKLHIYEEENSEPVIFLSLKDCGDNSIDLVATKLIGMKVEEHIYLLNISSEGVKFYRGIPVGFGFLLEPGTVSELHRYSENQ